MGRKIRHRKIVKKYDLGMLKTAKATDWPPFSEANSYFLKKSI